jgi:O-antigen ligase
VSSIYFNHAHNDYLELWLETGIVGASVFAAFAAWLVLRLVAVWIPCVGRRPATALSVAASLSIILLLAHSIVDYPLRTESLAVLFAFACGALARGSLHGPPAMSGS